MEMLIVVTAMACAAMGGVFFAFSSFVMPGLKRLPPAQGITAMQSINITAVTPVFMSALFGTAVLCLVVAVDAVREWRDTTSVYLIAGSLAYLIGTIAVTMVFNVPLNNAVAAADATSTGAVVVWTTYLQRWTAWNHLRTVASLIAAGLLMMARAAG